MDMTKDEALKMAIEAIKNIMNLLDEKRIWYSFELVKTINACKEALEQPANKNIRDSFNEMLAEKVDMQRRLRELPIGIDAFPEQPAQEPVAWNEEEFNAIAYAYRTCPAHEIKMVSDRYQELVNYVLSITHPAPSWKGLSDDEIRLIGATNFSIKLNELNDADIDFARAIEQALKEKNNG